MFFTKFIASTPFHISWHWAPTLTSDTLRYPQGEYLFSRLVDPVGCIMPRQVHASNSFYTLQCQYNSKLGK